MTPDIRAFRNTRRPLANGAGRIPALGFGTLIPDAEDTRRAVQAALEVGFRHLDCAERYRNEHVVGDAMREVFTRGEVQREDVFVATKLWNNNHRPERVRPAFEASRQRLRLEYVDLYLVHTPYAFQPGDDQDPRDEQGAVLYDSGVTLRETWEAVEDLVAEDKCKAIGLCNVDLETLRSIVEAARIKPAVVQVESHPYLPQWELVDYCEKNGIAFVAFAALAHNIEPRPLSDPVVTAIATRLGRTPGQVLLAWAVQRGTCLLTTSTNPGRIKENFEVEPLPEGAMRTIRDEITTRHRFNSVTQTGVPGFIPRGR
jgi:diketogulonate reductase-like aldo/keto reductase